MAIITLTKQIQNIGFVPVPQRVEGAPGHKIFSVSPASLAAAIRQAFAVWNPFFDGPALPEMTVDRLIGRVIDIVRQESDNASCIRQPSNDAPKTRREGRDIEGPR